ncbi:MAG: rhodanese-like domain-containing protein, partial [Bradyrhizobium sp.]
MAGFVVVILVAFAAFFPHPAYAIPSPDLIIGSLSSLSQIAMLAAAAVGGLAVTGSRPRLGGGIPARASPWRRVALWIALGVLALSLGGNLYQYLAGADAQLARFQATLVRPSHNPGEPILDPTLREESYSEQIADPNGISTQELATLLQKADQGQATDVNFIDVRETGETQLGELRHFTAVRWPDLFTSGIDFKNKRSVLICHNGNRSSETCAALSAQGIPCNFVIGGLEKWIADGRSMNNAQLRSPDQLRGVPRYPNDDVFLSTAEVHQLVDQKDALVVDARYPGEFEHSHVPGAVNITLRRLPTDVLKARIAALPKRPVVLACYDRRSCFMSTVLGLELSRAGFDVRGRYTLPWEYFIPTPEPPYVKAWRDSIDTNSWTKVSRILAKGLVWVADRGIGLPVAIVLLALLSRLLVLPVSLKAERDQVTLRTLSGEIAALKQRLGGDGKRFSRTLSALNRRHGMTPGRNLLALVFLPVLALSVAAVTVAAHDNPQALWWMSDLGVRDHTLLMPAIF